MAYRLGLAVTGPITQRCRCRHVHSSLHRPTVHGLKLRAGRARRATPMPWRGTAHVPSLTHARSYCNCKEQVVMARNGASCCSCSDQSPFHDWLGRSTIDRARGAGGGSVALHLGLTCPRAETRGSSSFMALPATAS